MFSPGNEWQYEFLYPKISFYYRYVAETKSNLYKIKKKYLPVNANNLFHTNRVDFMYISHLLAIQGDLPGSM